MLQSFQAVIVATSKMGALAEAIITCHSPLAESC